ncbi:uncharacterized protein ACA1_264220 [Acanthamoeba castellanii str. Neff]|uniref:Uncharacterized protein n=1 Tax=Acanthamoeba castellanii (strain ATCC 30010 / Neff) TaxID=1257118 RepID=L8H470_ACACF|nr:uncharacterized protein ACA1_264220 [Acanthamoeba castellanii str. Neff]ELR19251.1 hypothetical protein ACA1_264220 [Acanthamoeba castellanii str. Neff]
MLRDDVEHVEAWTPPIEGWRALLMAAASGLLMVAVCLLIVIPSFYANLDSGGGEHVCPSPSVLPPLREAVPFDVQLNPVMAAKKLPKLQSFAWALDGSSGRWLLVGGRTGGLHGFQPNDSFPTAQQNRHFHVLDPGQGFASWKLSVLDLPSVELADALQATNALHMQDADRLYVVGGYGYSRTQSGFVTHDLMISIDVPLAVRAVMAQNATLLASAIRSVREPRLQLSGGGLQKLGGWYFAVLGAHFQGIYPAPNSSTAYSPTIKMFKVVDEPPSGLQVVQFQQLNATGNQVEQWHRRDLHVLPAVLPGGQEFGISVYGGVFTPSNSLPFLYPIAITMPDGAHVHVKTNYGYQQLFSQYECATMVTYDNATGSYMTTFFGGMGLSYVTDCNEIVQDIRTPFVNVVSTMTRLADGTMTERVHAKSFLPGLLGTNAAFVPLPDVPLLVGDVIDLARLKAFKTGRSTLVGHMYGGIVAEKPNFGSTDASDLVFAVYITKLGDDK